MMPIDFIELWASQGLIFTNDRIQTASKVLKTPNVKISGALKKYTEFFADVCLLKFSLLSIDSFHLASSIIAVSRKALKVSQVWGKEMEMLTGLKYEEIESTVNLIEKYYNKMFPKAGQDIQCDKENTFLSASLGPKTARAPGSKLTFNTATLGTKCAAK